MALVLGATTAVLLLTVLCTTSTATEDNFMAHCGITKEKTPKTHSCLMEKFVRNKELFKTKPDDAVIEKLMGLLNDSQGCFGGAQEKSKSCFNYKFMFFMRPKPDISVRAGPWKHRAGGHGRPDRPTKMEIFMSIMGKDNFMAHCGITKEKTPKTHSCLMEKFERNKELFKTKPDDAVIEKLMVLLNDSQGCFGGAQEKSKSCFNYKFMFFMRPKPEISVRAGPWKHRAGGHGRPDRPTKMELFMSIMGKKMMEMHSTCDLNPKNSPDLFKCLRPKQELIFRLLRATKDDETKKTYAVCNVTKEGTPDLLACLETKRKSLKPLVSTVFDKPENIEKIINIKVEMKECLAGDPERRKCFGDEKRKHFASKFGNKTSRKMPGYFKRDNFMAHCGITKEKTPKTHGCLMEKFERNKELFKTKPDDAVSKGINDKGESRL